MATSVQLALTWAADRREVIIKATRLSRMGGCVWGLWGENRATKGTPRMAWSRSQGRQLAAAKKSCKMIIRMLQKQPENRKQQETVVEPA